MGRNLVVVIVGNLKSKGPLEEKRLKASVKFIPEGEGEGEGEEEEEEEEEEGKNTNHKLLLRERETSAQNKRKKGMRGKRVLRR